jgi:hypothetical protein
LSIRSCRAAYSGLRIVEEAAEIIGGRLADMVEPEAEENVA